MPQKTAAFKKIKQDKKKHTRNKSVKSELKTLAKKLEEFIAKDDQENIQKTLKKLNSKLDKACKKGIIHANKADRKKSRMGKKISKAAAAKKE